MTTGGQEMPGTPQASRSWPRWKVALFLVYVCLPSVLLLGRILLHIRLSDTVRSAWDLFVILWFAPGLLPLVPFVWAALRDRRLWRSRAIWLLLVGQVMVLIGIPGLGIPMHLTGQGDGIVQVVLFVTALIVLCGGVLMCVLALFIGLL